MYLFIIYTYQAALSIGIIGLILEFHPRALHTQTILKLTLAIPFF